MGLLLVAYIVGNNCAVKRVNIHGVFQYVEPLELKAVLQDLKITKNIFTVDIANVASSINVLPWVQHVSVARALPDHLVINITEREPLALWNKSGLIAADGSILYPRTLRRELLRSSGIPTFYASIQHTVLILEHYKFIATSLAKINLTINSISINKLKELKISLQNGIKVVFGNKDLSIRLNRFILAYSKELQHHQSAIDYVDMQYTNGFAIGWQQGVKRPKIGEEL
ncbi:MAG: hypothetical protein COC15_01440 [Legionellales bacterium]|nr:MAG: hypothetical protein COC15_01440 [Legionellales bacterium]